MIDYSESSVNHLSVHIVGNKMKEEKLILSPGPIDTQDDNLKKLLLTYFLSNFTSPEYYRFIFSDDGILTNLVFKLAASIFLNAKSFHKNSIRIAKHLYDITQHPNIKSGDLYLAYLSNVRIDNDLVDAIGIFKSEIKEPYLKLDTSSPEFKLKCDLGLNIHKLDKGCLILNAEAESGFKILAVDNVSKSDAQFWIKDFLNIKPCSDGFHHTKNFINLTRQYVDEQLDEEFSVSKPDKIELLNRSMNFFKSRDQFNQQEFEEEVLADASVIESFRNYERTLLSNSDDRIADNFEISAHALKKQPRVFKSVLKLDKNFHIYIHGNRQLIEKGFDEAADKHYYKIYFDQES